MSERLGELLIASGVLGREQMERAVAERKRQGGPLGRVLVDMGLVGEETYVRALSKQLQLAAVSLDPAKVERAVARAVPRETCERYGLVPFRLDRERGLLDIAMADATSNDAIDAIEALTKLKVRPFVAGPRAVQRVVEAHFADGVSAEKSAPVPAPADGGTPQRIDDLEEAVRRLEGLVLSLIGLLVDDGKIDREALSKRVTQSRGGKGR